MSNRTRKQFDQSMNRFTHEIDRLTDLLKTLGIDLGEDDLIPTAIEDARTSNENAAEEFESSARKYHRRAYSVRGSSAASTERPKRAEQVIDTRTDSESFEDDVKAMRRQKLTRK